MLLPCNLTLSDAALMHGTILAMSQVSAMRRHGWQC